VRRHGEYFNWLGSYGHAAEVHARIRDYFNARQTLPVDRGSGRTMLEAKTVQVSDVLADPEYALSDLQKIGGYRAALSVPLLREGDVMGAIFLARTVPQPFSDRPATPARIKVGRSQERPFCLCAEHERQLGGESPLSSLMTAKD
jgi:hypothetical protein